MWLYDTGTLYNNYVGLYIQDTTAGTGAGLSIRDSLANYSPDTTIAIPRTQGWHEWSMEVGPTGTSLFVDGTLVHERNDITSVDIVSLWSLHTSWRPAESYYFDDFEVNLAPVPVALTVTTSGSGTGTVELSPPGGSYEPGTTVTLTSVAAPGSFFDHWEGDLTGSDNPATILMDGDKSVVAHFIYPQLTVLSAPIVDVAITGTRAGSTPYTADCDLHEAVALTAPESVSVGGKTYYFELWFVDNVSVLPSEGRPFNELELTMDDRRTAVAQYGWRLPGDYNDDCIVNILDLLFVRNHLEQDPTTDDNWRADINQDGDINVLDLINVRNEHGTRCAEE